MAIYAQIESGSLMDFILKHKKINYIKLSYQVKNDSAKRSGNL